MSLSWGVEHRQAALELRSRLRAIVAVCTVLLSALPALAAPDAGSPQVAPRERRIALVIGNDDYAYVGKLRNAVADAKAMGAALRERGFDVAYRENVARHDFYRAVADFIDQLSTDTVGVFYYSGHGVQIDGENYLIPTDLKAEQSSDVDLDGIRLADILDRMGAKGAKFKLAIIDACRSNPFKSTTRAIGAARGLARTTSARGVMVVYAAGENQEAIDNLGDDDHDPNGLFTREFLKAMAVPGVKVQDVVFETAAKVSEKAASVRHEQTPAIYVEAVGTFYFTEPDVPPRMAAAAPGATAAQSPSAPSAALPATTSPAGPGPTVATPAPASAPGPAAEHARDTPPPAPKPHRLAMTRALPGALVYVHGDVPDLAGRAYLAAQGNVAEAFVRPPGGNRGIASAIYRADGDLYFCDATETRIYRVHSGRVETAYQHNAFVRHLGVDGGGRLYFSSSIDLHGDGMIFQLEAGKAIPVLSVRAADVGGAWSGTFAFDQRGALWLSTGSASPSGLYRVDNGRPVPVYIADDRRIMGFAFLADGSIAFADNAHSVYLLTLPGRVSKLFESPYPGRLVDVQAARRAPG